MGRRNRRVPILDSLSRDIEHQLAVSEVKDVFEDGKAHEFGYVNALFLDGRSLEHSTQTFLSKPVASAEEFDEALYAVTQAQASAFREAIFEENLALRTLARAALSFAAELMRQAGRKDDDPSSALKKAFQIIGTVAGSLDTVDLDHSMSLPEPIRRQLNDYLETTPVPPSSVWEAIGG